MARHPSVMHLVKLLEPNLNLPADLLAISQRFADLRDLLLGDIQTDTPEVAAGLRKILEAKDCFVRAGVEISHQAQEMVGVATAPLNSTSADVTPGATPTV